MGGGAKDCDDLKRFTGRSESEEYPMLIGAYRIFSPIVPNAVSALGRGQLRALLVRNYLKYLALELQHRQSQTAVA